MQRLRIHRLSDTKKIPCLTLKGVTHPGQNVNAILQPGTFLHHFLQTCRGTWVLRVFQGLDLCGNSLDLQVLKTRQSRTFKKKHKDKYSKEMKKHDCLWGEVKNLCLKLTDCNKMFILLQHRILFQNTEFCNIHNYKIMVNWKEK